ncbi:hypothetical protein [Streptomyces sp. HC307]|uniref:hypothetical protein n=1 Tax=Streptomyces flavusporus TaxID=3385496 RepID=UPI003916F5A8
MALAAFFISLSAVGLVAADAASEGRLERSLARTPRFVYAHKSEQPRALWSWQVADIDGMPYDVVFLEPLAEDAPLPPGLARWPVPGEVFLSEALREVGGGESIAARYGRYGGAIAPAGLEAPSERFAYVRPAARVLDKDEMQAVSGFGETSGDGFSGLVGEHLHMPAIDDFPRVYVLLVLLPVGVLAFGLAGVPRAGRSGPRAVAVPVVAGGLAAGLVAACAMTVDVPLPLVEFTLSGRDFRQAWPLAAAAVSAGSLAVLAVALLSSVLPRGRGRLAGRVADVIRRVDGGRWGLWLFPFLLVLVTRGAELSPAEYRGIVQILGSVTLLATFPGAVRAMVAGLGRAMCALGERARHSGGAALLAGRRMVAEPTAVSRPLSALAMAVLVAAQVQLWAGAVGDTTQGALDTRRALSSSMLLAGPSSSEARTAAFVKVLPGEAVTMGVIARADGGRLDIVGSCAALRETRLSGGRLPCTTSATRTGTPVVDPRLRALLAALAPADIPVYARVADVPKELAGADVSGDHAQLVLVGEGERRLPVPELSRVAHQELGTTGSVRMLGDEWAWGAARKVTAGRWVQLLSLAGLTALAATVVFRLRCEGPGGDSAAPTGSAHPRWVAWWYVAPAGVATMVSAALSAWWIAAPVNSVSMPGPGAMAIVLGPATLLLATAALFCVHGARAPSPGLERRSEAESATV